MSYYLCSTRTILAASAAAAGLRELSQDVGLASKAEGNVPMQAQAKPFPRRPGAARVPGEPTYSKKQVAEMDGVDGRRMWISYRDGVYDVTDFHHIHPGGGLIKQAAGADAGVFWDFWAHHHHAPKVGDYLDKLRIGALKQEQQMLEDTMGLGEEDDPYKKEPVRDKKLQRVFTERPYCSETPNDILKESYLTSADALYVRNHAPVPDCAWAPDGEDEARYVQDYEIAFDSSSDSSSFTIAQLESKFGTETVTSVLQCAGNRASEDIVATGPNGFSGSVFESITQGMLGNVEWSGVPLADVLVSMFPTECDETMNHGGAEYHVVFEGADGYSASAPLSRVLRRENGCLLATKMNGSYLTPDHGFPLRAMVPGVAGARNVKWLESIKLQHGPADSPWHNYYYKDGKAAHIQSLPLQSIILGASQDRQRGGIVMSGVAYGGGSGNAISRVEVSIDGGTTWIDTKLLTQEVDQSEKSMKSKSGGTRCNFGWVRWQLELENSLVINRGTHVTLCCRATDTEGITQPEVSTKHRGYLYNGWSKLDLKLAQ